MVPQPDAQVEPPTNWRTTLAALGRAERAGNHDEAKRLRRELKVAKLSRKIKAEVDSWPELTPAQLDHLASLLRGGRQ